MLDISCGIKISDAITQILQKTFQVLILALHCIGQHWLVLLM